MKLLCILAFLFGQMAFADYLDLPEAEVEKRLRMLDYNKNYKVKHYWAHVGLFGYDIVDVKLESTHPWTKTTLNTEFQYYRSKKRGARPLMVIIPPVLGVTPLDSGLAHYFVTKGYNVFVLKYNEQINDYSRPIKDFNRAMVSVLTSARLLLDYGETRREIDHRRVATYGMSLGAIVASIYAGVEDRVDAAVLIAGGGHLPEIMEKSEVFIARDFRNIRKYHEGIATDKDFKDTLENTILFDPLFFAHRKTREDIYMVIGENDSTVHSRNQIMLWEAFDRPEYFAMRGNHFFTILGNLFNHDSILRFLKRRLSKEI